MRRSIDRSTADARRCTAPGRRKIAQAVLYLASDDSAMMTSHTFTIDAGLSD